MTATRAAASIGPFVKELISTTIRARADGKQKLAFAFIVCGYDELLRAMDIVPVWTENFAGICGAKRDAERFLQRSQSLGFSRSLCTYALCGIGFDHWREELGGMPPDAPWGGQVRPDFMLSSGQMICDPRAKWYQACQQYMPDVPIYNVDMPYPLFDPQEDHRKELPYYAKYLTRQLRGLIGFLETQCNTKLNYDRLGELVDLTDRTWNLICETYDLRRARPCPMGTGDAMNTMVPICFGMGTQEAYDFFLDLKKELEEKIALKEGVIENERFRLLWGGGLPAWYALRDFNYFNSKGAVFPAETTYRMIAPLDEMDLPQCSDPVEHLAWRWLGYWTFWYDRARRRPGSEPDVERLIQFIERYKIDGVVMHEAFSCRSWHVGLMWQLHQLAKIYKPLPLLTLASDGQESQTSRELPSLILESDIIDISSYSQEHTRNKIDAFIETLESINSSKAFVSRDMI